MKLLLTTTVLLSLVAAPLCTASQDTGQNLTIGFYEGGQQSCDKGDRSKAFTMSLSDIPKEEVCLTLSQVFGQKKDSGYFPPTNSSAKSNDTEGGFDWTLNNRDVYRPKTDYSGLWIMMQNSTKDGRKPNDWAAWQISFFSNENCTGFDVDAEKYGSEADKGAPEFIYLAQDCQTDEKGLCETLPYPLGSFSIRRGAKAYVPSGAECENFVGLDEAEKLAKKKGEEIDIGALTSRASMPLVAIMALIAVAGFL